MKDILKILIIENKNDESRINQLIEQNYLRFYNKRNEEITYKHWIKLLSRKDYYLIKRSSSKDFEIKTKWLGINIITNNSSLFLTFIKDKYSDIVIAEKFSRNKRAALKNHLHYFDQLK